MQEADDDDLFLSLGVEGVSADDLSRRVIQAAVVGSSSAAAGLQEKAEQLQSRLDAVGAELDVVGGGMAEGDELPMDSLPEEERSGRELQRSLGLMRLEELWGTQERLRAELEQVRAELPPPPLPKEPGLRERERIRRRAAAAGGSDPSEVVIPKESRAAKQKQQMVIMEADDDDLFGDSPALVSSRASLPSQTERDRLIRAGVLTPFDSLGGHQGRPSGESDSRFKELASKVAEKMKALRGAKPSTKLLEGHAEPTQEEQVDTSYDKAYWRKTTSGGVNTGKKRRKVTLPRKRKALKAAAPRKSRQRDLSAGNGDTRGAAGGGETGDSSGGSPQDDSGDSSDYRPTDDSDIGTSDGEGEEGGRGRRRGRQGKRASRPAVLEEYDEAQYEEEDAEGEYDDEDDDAYEARVQWHIREGQSVDSEAPPPGEMWQSNSPAPQAAAAAYIEFDGGYKIPATIWQKLFPYQRTGVKWMWELHMQKTGGIMGDEMGLGKTIQVTAFLAGLHHSGKLGPSLVVAPATVLRQWLCEMRTWYPLFRVILLHDSMKNPLGARGSREELLDKATGTDCGVVLTTYEGLRTYRDILLPVLWSYVVLDEGHKIRNPDAEVTLVCKQVATVHRIIMSGSPIQNRLQELWSLFDFIFPGKLGTLPVFHAQFAIPITIGGYTNATAVQVSAAYRCSVTLRDLISPYLLRRKKDDVHADLPSRKEQVLFCSLTKEQRSVYRAYLDSTEVTEIFSGKRHALQGIDILRKVCNHPDLLDRDWKSQAPDYGRSASSGKLSVTSKILDHWKRQGHKALVFTQTQQMLDILEALVEKKGFRYHRMDGNTGVAMRARLMADFNRNPYIFVFLLTTKVGGLGVNLTGANRVLLYDPDWNPSTDMQARERAWRIGQKRDVTIYRLITAGTIEEKVYHRQIYKQFLTNKVLSDPKQKRFFTAKNIRDLFTLGEDRVGSRTETETIFKDVDGGVRVEEYRPLPLSTQEDADAWATGDGPSEAGPSASRPAPSAPASGQAGLRTALHPQQAPTGAAAAGELAGTGEDDSKILRDLMEGTGLQTAMDHSKIEGATSHDREIIDQEACRIAQQAAQALRESRRELHRAGHDITRPTWTGRSGEAGAPAAASRFGSVPGGRGGGRSSSAVLSQMRRRQQQVAAAATGRSPAGTMSSAPATAGGNPLQHQNDASMDAEAAQTLAAGIVSYLESKGGRAKGGDLVAHFQGKVPPDRMPLFRHILKEVAWKQKRREDVFWKLREEFKNAP